MIKIFVDKSGSMSETGKKDIAEMVLKSIENDFKAKNLNYNIFEFHNINQLTELDSDSMILTDGLFEINERKKGYAIAIGIDSDTENLKNFEHSFEAEDIMKLLKFYQTKPEDNEEEDSDEW